MRAIVIERPNEVALRDVDTPTCGPDDVLVRSHKAGVCRTDLEVLRGELSPRWVRYPCIPGHEWSGTVAEVGMNVRDLSPGERVVCEGIVPCKRCRRCRAGDTNLCENYDQLGFTRGGGYGEFVLAPRHVVHAEVLGADHTVYVGEGDAVEETARLTGEGLDVVVETAGAVPAVELATRVVRPGGRVILLGIAGEGKTLGLPADRIVLRDIELIGSVSYTSAVWGRMMRLVEGGLLDLEPLVTHRFPTREFEAAFELMDRREGTVAKILLEHDA
jgi:threonine dehydrogenase-like Zn-dependent dehydrogenase